MLLDRGFFSVPVIRWLKALDIYSFSDARNRSGQARRHSATAPRTQKLCHTIHPPESSLWLSGLRVVCRYLKGRRGKHGIDYFLYVVHRVKVSLSGLHQHYRARFGIETSYRIKNLCRIRTTTKNPVARFLFVALAFILVNLWIYLLWCFVSIGQCGRRIVYPELFSLKTMLEFLSHTVERHFPVITAIFLPVPE